MSGSYYVLNQKYNTLQAQIDNGGGGGGNQNIYQVLGTGNDANGLGIVNVGGVQSSGFTVPQVSPYSGNAVNINRNSANFSVNTNVDNKLTVGGDGNITLQAQNKIIPYSSITVADSNHSSLLTSNGLNINEVNTSHLNGTSGGLEINGGDTNLNTNFFRLNNVYGTDGQVLTALNGGLVWANAPAPLYPQVFQASSLAIPFTGDINTTISLVSPVLGLCQISGRVELRAGQPTNIGDIKLQVRDGITVVANQFSQVNSQGLVTDEYATAQILCMVTISTNAVLSFTLSNITGGGLYNLFLDIIQFSG